MRARPSRLARLASHVSSAPPGLGPAGVAAASVQEGLLPPPPPPRAPFVRPGRRRTQGFDVPSPASHPVRFYVTFRRFNNLFPICACALLKHSPVPMETGPSPPAPSHSSPEAPGSGPALGPRATSGTPRPAAPGPPRLGRIPAMGGPADLC